MLVTITKTVEAQKMGEYNRTIFDVAKELAEYRIVSVNPFYVINNATKEGKTMTRKELEVLKKNYLVVTDF
jgi:hypothetical protein